MKKLVLTAFAATTFAAFAKIDMATPFTDGVILQRERAVPVWGKAEPGRKVTVSFAGKKVSTVAGKDGAWSVKLPSMAASKVDRVMRVTEAEDGIFFDTVTDTVEVKDVLVGEVWMCAGQSNADCPIWCTNPRYRDSWGAMMLLTTVKPHVRFVKNPHVASVKPRYDYKVEWVKATPDMYKPIADGGWSPSAMGYYFALEIANQLDIPVGVIVSTWSGTNIDAWTPRSGYKSVPALRDVAALPRLEKDAFKKARADGIYKDKAALYTSFVQQPTILWNGMVAAFAPMACRGLLWYQGCHNRRESERYCDKMHALYNGWSKEFKNPDFKLYFAQLAPWKENFCGIVEAQNKFVAEQKNAELAVLSDVGNFDDIHPSDKRTVAKRLSLHALKNDYGFASIRASSPLFKSVKFEGGKAVMTFDNADGWYVYSPDWSIEPAFDVAGKDGVWHAAKLENVDKEGRVKGKTLTVASDKVPDPVKVRYLYRDRTAGTVYNEAALPLGPFRSK